MAGLTQVNKDVRHPGIGGTGRATGCIPEGWEIPQKNWCGPQMAVSHMLFNIGTYTTGGVSLKTKSIGFSSVWQVEQPVALSPYLEAMSDPTFNQYLCYGLVADLSNKCLLKLILCTPTGELADNTVVNKDFWLEIYGTH
jgi:hypothetical protein